MDLLTLELLNHAEITCEESRQLVQDAEELVDVARARAADRVERLAYHDEWAGQLRINGLID
jgi:hypothetical protein